MAGKNIITLFLIAGLVFVVLFDIDLPLDFGGRQSVQAPDLVVEEQYDDCYQMKDKAMHGAVFAAIDNPDVQKEMISTNRERIARECRQLFPQKLITLEQQTDLNLVDLSPRFW